MALFLSHWLPALVLAGLAAAGAQAQPAIAFDTEGGDAWTFDLPVTGRIHRDDCESVAIRAPSGTLPAVVIDRRFVAEVPLRSGTNRIQAICRKGSRDVARSQEQIWRLRLEDRPKAWIRLRVDGDRIHLDGGRTQTAPGLAAPLVRYEWRAREGNPAPLHALEQGVLDSGAGRQRERIEIATPPLDGEYYVDLHVEDALGRSDRAAAVFRVVNGRAESIDVASEHPRWVDTAVLYGATPYVFEPQTFAGLRERLDEIAALGATALWLSPVTAAAEDDFGYAVTDHFRVRARFGTQAQLHALIDEAHHLGLRVLIDFVPNHFSERHPYFVDALERGTRSAYYDWFERDAQGEAVHYFDWTHLKNLDFDNPEVRNYMTAAFAQFVRDYGVDGFRVDASWAVARRAPEFWPRLREELKRIDPDLLLLAEASAREPYHVAHGFDAAYDWNWKLGEWAWAEAFGKKGAVDLAQLRAALTNHGAGFPPDSLILRFLNNNDTGERFASRHGPALSRLAATMVFTLPGVPLIYNGDELGAAFEPYDEGPPIEWDDTAALTAHYRKLTTLRRDTPALRTREMQLLTTDRDDEVLAYLRPGATAAEHLLVLLNFSARPLTVRPADPQAHDALAAFAQSRDLMSGTRLTFNPRSPAIPVPATSALVLRSILGEEQPPKSHRRTPNTD